MWPHEDQTWCQRPAELSMSCPPRVTAQPGHQRSVRFSHLPKMVPKTNAHGWFDLDWFGLIWIDLDWFGLIWFDLDWFGLIWIDLDWFELIWGMYNDVPNLHSECCCICSRPARLKAVPLSKRPALKYFWLHKVQHRCQCRAVLQDPGLLSMAFNLPLTCGIHTHRDMNRSVSLSLMLTSFVKATLQVQIDLTSCVRAFRCAGMVCKWEVEWCTCTFSHLEELVSTTAGYELQTRQLNPNNQLSSITRPTLSIILYPYPFIHS